MRAAMRAAPRSGAVDKETTMSDVNVKDELSKIAVEPFLPIEKKLIGWSLGLGVGLLVILTIANKLFPVSI